MIRRTPLTRTRFERRRPAKKRSPRGNATGPATPWAEVRLQAAERAGWCCERCGSPFRTFVDERTGDMAALFDGHHRKLRSQGGIDAVENCAALCHDCHTAAPHAVHRRPAEARFQGFIVPPWDDPAQWAVILHDGRTVRFTTDGQYDVVWEAAA